jgi:hypothetical protein
VIKEVKNKYFMKIDDFAFNKEKIIIKKDRVIIMEDDERIRSELVEIIKSYYG